MELAYEVVPLRTRHAFAIARGVDPDRRNVLVRLTDGGDEGWGEAEMGRALRFNYAARSAVSAAAHDLVARRLGVPLHRLWGLDAARLPRSSFTIAIPDTDDELRRRVS